MCYFPKRRMPGLNFALVVQKQGLVSFCEIPISGIPYLLSQRPSDSWFGLVVWRLVFPLQKIRKITADVLSHLAQLIIKRRVSDPMQPWCLLQTDFIWVQPRRALFSQFPPENSGQSKATPEPVHFSQRSLSQAEPRSLDLWALESFSGLRAVSEATGSELLELSRELGRGSPGLLGNMARVRRTFSEYGNSGKGRKRIGIGLN